MVEKIPAKIKEYLLRTDIPLVVVKKIDSYVNLLLEKNREMNLTGLKNINSIWDDLILDSLLVMSNFRSRNNLRILDAGSGGGIPGIPIAISCPNVPVLLLDSVNKKCRFLTETIDLLELKNARVENKRLEDAGNMTEYRELFDIVTAKGLAKLPTIIELTSPFLKPGGFLYAPRGENITPELNDAKNAIRILGMKIVQVKEYTTLSNKKRNLIILKKVRRIEKKYPRRPPLPKKNPL